jgi:hypothetical protein
VYFLLHLNTEIYNGKIIYNLLNLFMSLAERIYIYIYIYI